MPDADETTARDRAMVIITVADADYADALDAGGPSFAARIVDALCAHPEVLRALAGAPTADVADERDALHQLREERNALVVALREMCKAHAALFLELEQAVRALDGDTTEPR